MKKLVLATVLCCTLLSLANSQQTIIASGNMQSGTLSSVAWTLGELATITLKSDQKVVTQGIIQPPAAIVSNITFENHEFSLNFYPNPTHDLLFIETSKLLNTPAYGSIISIDGKIVQQFKHESLITRVNLSQVSKGLYFLKLYNNKDNIISTYKIIKY